MKLIATSCICLLALFAPGAFASNGVALTNSVLDEALLSLDAVAVLLDKPVSAETHPDTLPRPRRRVRSSSVMAVDSDWSRPDTAVHTQIQTCQGVSVTITSFGGGDWADDLDEFCDASPNTDDVTSTATPKSD